MRAQMEQGDREAGQIEAARDQRDPSYEPGADE